MNLYAYFNGYLYMKYFHVFYRCKKRDRACIYNDEMNKKARDAIPT